MKKIVSFCVIFAAFGVAIAQTPTYNLTVKNDNIVSATELQFDIYIEQTGTNAFELATAQLILNFDNTSINTGGTMSFSVVAATSELTLAQQPSTTSISGTELRINAKTPPGAGSGTIIPVAPGLRIARFKLTNTVPFNVATPNIVWKNAVNPYTKINGYVASVNTDISTPGTHLNSLTNAPLPVELVSFRALAKGRSIELAWSTKTETNNYGFDVERLSSAKDANWEKLTFVEGKGTTNAPQNYSYKDVVKSAGTFTYRLKQTDRDGKFTYSAQVEAKAALTADDYKMSQNYPNPFNPSTKFNFAVGTPQQVSVKVFNSLGQEVQTLFNDIAPADQIQEVTFDGARLASGIYFYVLRAQDRVEVKKMLMMK